MPTLRQLKALSLVAQTGSFTHAAERLFVTQSAVSLLIRDLEEEVGERLVVRGRALRLTEAGEHVQRAGDRAYQEIDRALKEVSGKRTWTRTVLTVAAGSLSAATLVPRGIARLAQTHDSLRVVLIDRPVKMMADLLLSGEADIGVGSVESHATTSARLRSELLLSDLLTIVCARNSTLAKSLRARRRRVTWSALEDSELILVGRLGGQWNSLLQDELARQPSLRVGYEVQLYSTALELVRCNLGVAVLPRFASRHLDPAAFSVHPLHAPGSCWNTYIVTRKEAEAGASGLAAFQDCLKAVVAEGGG